MYDTWNRKYFLRNLSFKHIIMNICVCVDVYIYIKYVHTCVSARTKLQ